MGNISDKICIICATAFLGGPTARYCPRCRAERIKERDRERHLRKISNRTRQIGSTDICVICSDKYVVTGGNQKYCKNCTEKQAKE